jgi:hypothetical protein
MSPRDRTESRIPVRRSRRPSRDVPRRALLTATTRRSSASGRVNSNDSVVFLVDVVDGGEPSADDRFEIRLTGPYDSTLRPLTNENIKTH